MRYFPVFLDFDDADVLVVGGGDIATRKLRLIARTNARITVVAPTLLPEIQALAGESRVVHVERPFQEDDIKGQRYVVAATNDETVNRTVAAVCAQHNILVNVVDDPESCTAITPAMVDRDPVMVAIGTEGAAPVIARRLREQIEALLPSQLGNIARFVQRHRPTINTALAPDLRRRAWEAVLDGKTARLVAAGDDVAADAALQDILAEPTLRQGHVALVGAGPGSADLLTLRAARLLQDADVVLHDRLVSPEVMEMVRRDAERIDVGKQADNHPVPQDRINQLLIDQAHLGRRVVRLKGGDPFVFGRGGEEIAKLREAGVTFEVVPGVTAANACAAYAGIPLTHRDHAQSVMFVTGHRQKNGDLDLPWTAMARPQQTVVIYMGLGNLPDIAAALIGAGCPPARPAAVIQSGATQRQTVVAATIATIADAAKAAQLGSPSLVVVGDVVALRESLSWFAPND